MFRANFMDYYDVWGNAEDGYEVNDATQLYEGIELPDLEDETLFEALKERGYFQPFVKREEIKVEDFYPSLEIVRESDDFPLGVFTVEEVL